MSNSSDIQDENILKILVATDIHLGVHEKDPVRGNDSFIAFEEVLQHAVQNDVDFILLAGDLFHIANPSTNTLQKCMQLLRTYTLGDKMISFEIKSDQTVNFNSINETVNYQDPNMNIKYPVFSIHGNHDDPSGFGRLSALDLLSTTGLINYFGKWTDLTKVEIDPILIKKGETQLAMYGLSHIHDNRLARLFYESKVVMAAPDDASGTWFNLLVLHQNRADRGPKNYLPEDELPDFLNLIIWGHEHDCRILPEENQNRNFYVSQPGSSVATSLSEGEAIDKHIGLLLIHGNKFRMEPIKLKSVRPFIFDTVKLDDVEDEYGLNEGDTVQKVQEFVTNKISDMMVLAKEKETEHPNQPKEPLIRLRIIYTKEDHLFNAIRFGQQYNQKVANPLDMILLKRLTTRNKFDLKTLDSGAMNNAAYIEENESNGVEDIVEKYFEEVDPSKSLEIVPVKAFSELCRRLVINDDDDAAERILKFYADKSCEFLNENMPTEENIDESLNTFINDADTFKAMLSVSEKLSLSSNKKMLDSRGTKNRSTVSFDLSNVVTTNEPATSNKKQPSPFIVPAKPARGKGAARGGRGARGGASSSKAELNISKTSPKQQPSVAAMFTTAPAASRQSSQSGQTPQRSSQRAAVTRRGKFTEYIEDSDSD